MFRLDDVAVRYPDEDGDVFAGVDLELDDGKLMVLVGANGAGKTTLLRTMCGLVRPRCGSVVVDGHDVVRAPDSAQHLFGVSLYPERSFYFRLTARQNLRYYAALRGIRRREAPIEVERVLAVAGLLDHAELPFMRLSLGLRKRLGFARALLGSPRTLLLDEPFANLDAPSADALIAHLASMRAEGHSVVMSTHEAAGVASLVDVVGQLRGGRLVTTDERRALVLGKTVMVETRPAPDPHTDVPGWTRTPYGFTRTVDVHVDLVDVLADIGRAGFAAERVGTRQEASVIAVGVDA